jgi:hypothetical protein
MEARATAARLHDRPEAANTPRPPREDTASAAKAARARLALRLRVRLAPAPDVREDFPVPVPEARAPEVSVVPVLEASAARVQQGCVLH